MSLLAKEILDNYQSLLAASSRLVLEKYFALGDLVDEPDI